jgi:hypothetical protein
MITIRKLSVSLFVCWLAIAATALQADDTQKPPSYVPAKLHLGIGCPIGTVYTVDLEGEVLKYEIDRDGEDRKEKKIKPTPQAWRQFWKALDQARVWQWRPEYGGVGHDGADWSIEIERSGKAGRRLQTRGHNTYPDDKDVRRISEVEPSRTFKAYLQAVRNLLGGEAFR